MTEPGEAAADRAVESDRVGWGLVGGLSLISIGLAAYEIAPASVTPLIRASLGIDATAAGLLVGVMFGIAVVTSLPTGAIIDRTDTRTALALSVMVFFVAGGWGWWAARDGAFGSLLLSRVVAGAAFVVVWNAGIDIIIEAVPAARRATAVGVFTASAPLGFAVGQGLSPLLASRWDWPTIFVGYHGFALIGLAVFWWTSRGLGSTDVAAPSVREFEAVLRNRNVWLVGSLGFVGYSLYLFVNSWGPSFLTDVVGVSLGLAGLLVALFPAMGVLSRIGGGVLSDRLFDGRRRPVVSIAFVVATPLVATFPLLRRVALLVVSLLVAGFAIQLMIGLSFVYVRELVSSRVGATAVAVLSTAGFAGAFLSPVVGGAIIDEAGYPAAFFTAALLSAVGIVVTRVVPETG